MPAESLKLLSAAVVESLFEGISKNLPLYRSGDFLEMARSNGWEIETGLVSWDPAVASLLDPSGSPDAEVKNSLLIYAALEGMTPAMARDERLWARLCHVECLVYARDRWIRGDDRDMAAVRSHFFAAGVTGARDDNAIGRLWWNAHVARLALPDDPALALRRLLARANNRLQIFDRADTAFRQPLVGGIVRLLGEEPWLDSDDKAIAHFMREVNKRSGGFVFEALEPEAVDDHLRRCVAFAKAGREATGVG